MYFYVGCMCSNAQSESVSFKSGEKHWIFDIFSLKLIGLLMEMSWKDMGFELKKPLVWSYDPIVVHELAFS